MSYLNLILIHLVYSFQFIYVNILFCFLHFLSISNTKTQFNKRTFPIHSYLSKLKCNQRILSLTIAQRTTRRNKSIVVLVQHFFDNGKKKIKKKKLKIIFFASSEILNLKIVRISVNSKMWCTLMGCTFVIIKLFYCILFNVKC